jgi:hypothetical protein
MIVGYERIKKIIDAGAETLTESQKKQLTLLFLINDLLRLSEDIVHPIRVICNTLLFLFWYSYYKLRITREELSPPLKFNLFDYNLIPNSLWDKCMRNLENKKWKLQDAHCLIR